MATVGGDVTIKAKMALAKAMESAHRRDLVGGLIRYLKDGETDFANLLFHYVHVEDYGLAMIEGWGELHKLLTEPSQVIGPYGLSYREFDFWEQAIMSELAERGEVISEPVARERIIEAARRIKIYRGGDMLRDFERDEISLMTKGFAAAGCLSDLLAEPGEDEEEGEEYRYEEDDDEEGETTPDSVFM
jgi:hypothetical protein